MEDRHKKAVTVMLILAWASMGLFVEIGGPTMLDMRILFDCNAEEIAHAVSGLGVGIFLGALFAGVLVNVVGSWKILIVSGAQIVATVTLMTAPYVGSLSALWAMFFMLGTSAGITNVAGQRIILEIWKEKSPSPMHATHMGFGFGAVLAPLIANPFLAVLEFNETNTTAKGQDDIPGSESFVIVEKTRVQYAYVTIGLVILVLSVPLFIYPFIKCCSRGVRDQYANFDTQETSHLSRIDRVIAVVNPATYAAGSLKFGTFVFVIIGIFFMNLVGGEQLFGNFVRTFSVDQLKFPRDEASYLDTVYWGSFTLGRFLGAVFSHYVHIRTLFLMDASLYLIAVTFLDIFSARSKALLWTFTAIVGFVVAPLFPAGVSYANTQIEVGGMVLTLIIFMTGFGQMFYIWVEGILYQRYGPRTTLYTMQFSAISVFLIVIIFIAFTYKKKDRFSKQADASVNMTSNILASNGVASDMRYTELDQSSNQSED